MRCILSLVYFLLFATSYLSAKELAKSSLQNYSAQESSIMAEAEPSTFVNKSVNVIFGTFYQSTRDLTVPGPLPLHLQHYYSSGTFFYNWPRYSSISTNYPGWIAGLPLNQESDYAEMIAEEDGGSIVKYVAKRRKACKTIYSYHRLRS